MVMVFWLSSSHPPLVTGDACVTKETQEMLCSQKSESDRVHVSVWVSFSSFLIPPILSTVYLT